MSLGSLCFLKGPDLSRVEPSEKRKFSSLGAPCSSLGVQLGCAEKVEEDRAIATLPLLSRVVSLLPCP